MTGTAAVALLSQLCGHGSASKSPHDMEYDTLTEAIARLPRFAGQFGVPVADMQRMFEQDWLPHVQVVKVPDELRQLDPRAAAVRAADPNDYAAASLAALLSPTRSAVAATNSACTIDFDLRTMRRVVWIHHVQSRDGGHRRAHGRLVGTHRSVGH